MAGFFFAYSGGKVQGPCLEPVMRLGHNPVWTHPNPDIS
jgi:hypothetical protein